MTAQIVPSISMTSYFLYGLLLYLAAINIVAFFLYGIDKWKAQPIGGCSNKLACYENLYCHIYLASWTYRHRK